MIIIYAHPNKEGHCGHVLQKAQEVCAARNVPYTLLDLYEMGYDPVMKPGEHYTSGHRDIGPDTAKLQELIKANDRFLIIYPTWWNGTPAILKGFFDRTFTSHFAFRYVNGIPRGLLSGKAAVITTTGGHAILEKVLLGSRSLKVVVRDTLRFCGIKAEGYMIGSATQFTEKQKRKIERIVPRALDHLLA